MTPVKRLMNIVIATATAGVLATSPAPAMADRKSDNMLKALLGIAVLGAIIHETKKEKRPAPPPVVIPQPPVVVVPDRRADLPRACAMEITGLRNEHTGYGESCLIDYGYNVRLPRHCAHDTRIQGRPDRIFAANCLAEAGFHARRQDQHQGQRRDQRRGQWHD